MATVFGLLASMLVVAADEPVATVPDIAAIKSVVEVKFQQSRPELKIESVESAPRAGR